MSPEQARGQSADLRSDIFSLGIVLYEMIAGVNPFRRETSVDTISAILRDIPPPAGSGAKTLPPALTALLDKALQKKPQDRFSSAREMEASILEVAFRLTPNYYPLTKSIVDCHLEMNQKQKAIDSLNRYLKVVRSGYGFQQARARLEKIQSK